VELRILDGADSIGGTKILLDTGGARLLLDFGINYKRFGAYFEEYLKPRSSRGLFDLWRLGLIPHHPDIYREDLWPEDLRQDGEPLEVDLILLSHAHMDHCGLLGLVRPEIPVAASPAAWAVLKAVQDAGKAEFYSETAYVVPKIPLEDPRALKSAGWKFQSAQGRSIRLTGGVVPDELVAFLNRPPNPNGRALKPGEVRPLREQIGGYEIHAFPVDHSIPGALGYAIETDAGWVVYTGDLRLHGEHREATLGFVEEARRLRPRVLLIEGTSAGPFGKENPTEKEVQERALEIVKGSSGKHVVADFSPRQIERQKGFLEIAQDTGRMLVVLTKDMYLLEALEACGWLGGVVNSPRLAIYDDVVVSPKAWDSSLRKRYRERLVGPKDVKDNPGKFILAFSFWDLKNLLDIEPEGGVYIYSSSEAHGEEQEIDMARLWEWLKFFRMEVHGFEIDADGRPQFGGGLHASGHASPEDLLFIAREIAPRTLIPIHTENSNFYCEHLRREPIEVSIARNGTCLAF
jgi:ribonuclease J